MSTTPVKILFVCTGNICRSPTAEAVVGKLARRQGLAHRVELDSAGTHAYHLGQAPDARSQKYAAIRHYDLSTLRARQVSQADFAEFDYLLAMDREHLQTLQKLCPAEYQDKLALFLDFALNLPAQDVPDPYYGEVKDFELVLDLCEQAGQALLQKLFD